MNETHTSQNNTHTRESVLAQIESRVVVMRPKIYFTLRIIGIVVLSVIVLLFSIFILGMISFSLRVSGHAFLLGRGFQGVLLFLRLFPWIPLVVTVGVLALLVKLLRTFSFGYRQPVIFVLAFVGLFCLGAGIALDRATPVNDRMFDSAMRAPRPGPVDALYRGAKRVPPPLMDMERREFKGVKHPLN